MLSTLKNGSSAPITVEEFSFKGVRPDVQACRARGRHQTRLANRGHAYCQVGKTGQLFTTTNWTMCKDFVCEHAWLMAWWRLRKLTARATIHELLRSRCKAEQCIRDIEFTVARERAESQKTEQSSVKNMLREHLVAFKRFPLVDLWLSQYCGLSYGRLPRFKFLVLEGASRLGKSQLAINRFGHELTHVCNCQEVQEPNLRGFDRAKHRCIVYDEITWETVIRNKVLFQASAEGVHLRQSKCQQFAEWKFLYHVPMICCTNAWLLPADKTEHRDWLEANTVHVYIQSPCWDQSKS